LLISIHSNANSFGQWQAARGVGVYAHTTRKDLVKHQQVFCQQIALATGLPLHGTGVHYADLAMNKPAKKDKQTGRISGILCDSLLLEIGFHDNRQDVEIMKQSQHPANVAKGIINALEFLYPNK
jgi:N-acetylmuramoyl-L-alanine amidase